MQCFNDRSIYELLVMKGKTIQVLIVRIKCLYLRIVKEVNQINYLKKINNMQVKKYSVINLPDIEYDKYSEKFQNKMNELNKLFDLLWKLPKVKDVIEINEK